LQNLTKISRNIRAVLGALGASLRAEEEEAKTIF